MRMRNVAMRFPADSIVVQKRFRFTVQADGNEHFRHIVTSANRAKPSGKQSADISGIQEYRVLPPGTPDNRPEERIQQPRLQAM